MTRENQLAAIKRYAFGVLAQDTSGHSTDHIQRVVALAEQLATQRECDLFLIQAAAYLHDVTDDKLVADVPQAEADLRAFLIEIGLSAEEIRELQFIIEHVSFSRSLAGEKVELTIEAKIVQDADRLDAIGAMGIARTFYYGGFAGHKIYDPEIPPRENMTKEEYRINQTVLNHFYEKLLLLPDLLQTPMARELAKPRIEIMESFLAAFKTEWSKQ